MISGAGLAGLAVCLFASSMRAQQAFFYAAAPSGSVTVARDVDIGVGLKADIHRPTRGARAPVMIFFRSSFGAIQARDHLFWAGWARAAAANGIVGVLPDIRADSAKQDFNRAVDYLTAHAAEYGIDPDAIVVYAGSGNVSQALPVVQDPSATRVKAAVMYYGAAPIREFRRDLPVLFVRAGLDRPELNATMTNLAALAVSQNAPVTLLNYPGGHHAFEGIDDNTATRDVIDRTFEFVKRATAPAYQTATRAATTDATAAAHVMTREFGAAAALYRDLLAQRPNDAQLRLSYGEALLGDRKFAEACAQFAQLKDKGLGARDLGLPAARACLHSGDQDAAVGWLKTIPSRFLPRSVESDSVFAPLRARADFRALFTPPG
jgi:hypothetical protein